MSKSLDLPALLDSLDPHASAVHRHLWLIHLVAWVRGDGSAVASSISRLNLLLDALEMRPQTRELLRQ